MILDANPPCGTCEAAEASLAARGRRDPPRLLVADDDPDMRALVASALRHDGYAVAEASCGAEVLERLEPDGEGDIGFDGVVSDVRMPGLGGLDIVAELRGGGVTIPILLITAFGDEATHLEADRLGATALLDKPFELHDLRMAVLNLVPLRKT